MFNAYLYIAQLFDLYKNAYVVLLGKSIETVSYEKGNLFRIAYQTLKGIISEHTNKKKPAYKQLAGSLFHTINQSN